MPDTTSALDDVDQELLFHEAEETYLPEDDQNVATKAMLSNLEDTDFNEAITRFQTLQTALQANLQTTGRLLNLNLLDFLQ